MKLALGSAWLFLACGLMARAYVNYDVIQSAKWPPAQTDSTVPWTNAGIFAISPKLYAPVLEGTAQEVTHIHIANLKMIALGSKLCRIYDLQAATLTTVDLEARTYAVESLDAAYKRYKEAAGYKTDRELSISAVKTGKMVQLSGQEATEYEIVTSRKRLGKRKITARRLCWIADRPPIAELDEFRTRWSARTNLPFLGDILPPAAGGNAYIAIAKTQAAISGYVLGFVTEVKSAESQISLEGRPLSAYDASHNRLPVVEAADGGRHPSPGLIDDPFVHLLGNDRLIQINLLNFTNSAVNPIAFVIPSGFKLLR